MIKKSSNVGKRESKTLSRDRSKAAGGGAQPAGLGCVARLCIQVV